MGRDPNMDREGTPSEQCLVAQNPGKIQHFYGVFILSVSYDNIVSDIAMFVLKRDVKLQLTNSYDNKVLFKYQAPCCMH